MANLDQVGRPGGKRRKMIVACIVVLTACVVTAYFTKDTLLKDFLGAGMA